jgi:SSS family solute:Na+ symporter
MLLGYPVSAIAFFCTDQAMVQSVLGARNLEQGQLGIGFIGWLKVLALPLFILPGILCFVLYPGLENTDLAYMTMVTNLFPPGMTGLVIVVLIAVLVGTIGSSLNALSTVYTTDIYLKSNPQATTEDQIRVGRISIAIGCLFAIGMAVAIDNIRGQNLFNIFQAVLGFLAPSLSVTFLLAVFWKRTTRRTVNAILSWGSAFSLLVGILYLWVFPADRYPQWPHFLMLSFWIFAILMISAIFITLTDRKGREETAPEETGNLPATSRIVKISFTLLAIIILALYLFFNGHT